MRFVPTAITVFVSIVSSSSPQSALSAPPQAASTRQTWTTDSVISALAWRERLMSNCALSMSEDEYAVPPAGPEKFWCTTVFDVKIRKGIMLLRTSQQWAKWAPPGESFKNEIEESNGQFTAFVSDPDSPPVHGGRRIGTPAALGTTKSFEVLGLSAKCTVPGPAGAPRPFMQANLPYSAWIRRSLAPVLAGPAEKAVDVTKSKADVVELVEEGLNCVQMTLSWPIPGVRSIFTWVPDRDFAIKQYEQQFQSGAPGGWSTVYSYRVQRYEQMGNLWIPAESEAKSNINKSAFIWKCKVTAFSMHTPTEGEMTVRYPVGCVVVDSIREVCYEVQADGALKYTPFLNTLTGKVIQPPTDPTSSPAPSEK